jgi:hypothetical protein
MKEIWAVSPTKTTLAFIRNLLHHFRMKGYVYILASKRNGTLYTGVTSDLARRLL